MKNAESITFGGSNLDRAAHLRETEEFTRDSFETNENYTGVLIYQGRVLVDADTNELARLSGHQPVLNHANVSPIFLGLEDGNPVLAFDISAWEDPNADPEAQQLFLDPTVTHHPDLPQTLGFKELRGIMTDLNPRDAELAVTARGVFEWHKIHGFCANCGEKTNVTKAGWQRDCPACGRGHFPRTDPVVIMLVTHGESVLLGRAPSWPQTMYSLLAGFMEPGETVEAAVKRETFEEAGIKVGEVSYLASQPWCFPSSLMIGCHGVALNTDITIDPIELEDARWFTKSELVKSYTDEEPSLMPARPGAIAHFLIRNWLQDTLD